MGQANTQVQLDDVNVENAETAIALTVEELDFIAGGECVVNSI